MDLTVSEPRGMDAELEGYAWLPRMLDKARATAAGTNGTFLFPCPVDHTCMAWLGITPDLVLTLVAEHDDDHAVLEALRAYGIPPADDAWFNGQGVEDELQATGNYLRVRPAVTLDPVGGPHHGEADVIVCVLEGAATFYLGADQARIVQAGEFVRIPANVEHRWAQWGQVPLRATATYDLIG